MPDSTNTVTCNETTYTPGTGTGDDPGIEYDFGNSSTGYTINFEDDPDDSRVFTPSTSADSDHGLHAEHAGTGDLDINMGVPIHTAGSGAHAVYGHHTGDGDLTISASGGIWTRGSDAYAIYGHHTGSGALTINVTGGDIDTYYVGSDPHAIYGYHEGSGDIDVLITDTTVDTWTGANTIRLDNGDGSKTVTLRNSTVWLGYGGDAIWFSGGSDDLLTVGGTTTIYQNVVFGDGADKFVLNTCLQADVDQSGNACAGMEAYGDLEFNHRSGGSTGLETISKIGSGLARLVDLAASGAAMSLKYGDLHLTGHLNLGAAGTLTIHDATRLIFGAASATDYGRITADKVMFDGTWDNGEKLYLAGGSTLAAGSDLLRNTEMGAGKFYDSADANEVAPKLYDLGDEELATVASDGVVSARVSADDLECGPVPTTGNPRTIICDGTTYNPLSNRGDDPGIEYDFDNSANDYAIDVRGAIDVTTTDNNDSGLYGRHTGTGGLAIAMSGDGIRTEGSTAYGIHGDRSGSGALSIDLSRGGIVTEGSDAFGIFADHRGSGDAAIEMSGGSVRTEGTSAIGLEGQHFGSGDLTMAMSGGSIVTEGSRAYGIDGYRAGSGDLAIEMSGGSIRTEGRFARGLYGYHYGRGDLTMAMSGGRIETAGETAHGIFGYRSSSSSTDALDIAMSGGSIATEGYGSHGISGQHWGSGRLGAVLSGGSIHTNGIRANGLQMAHYGTGDLAVSVSDSRIRTEGDFAHGIIGFRSRNGVIEASVSNSLIETTGGNANPVNLGYASIDPGPDFDSVLMLRESRIESAGGYAIRFPGSSFFAGGDDLVMIGHGRTMVRGKVYFGTEGRFDENGRDRLASGNRADIDRLTFHTGPDEYIELNPARIGEDLVLEGLEFIDKTGLGWARIGTLRADGALMNLSGGDLRLGGHLDLGERGQLNIHDSSRLIFEAERYGEQNHGRITAQQVLFLPGPSGFGERRLYLADRTTALFAGADLLVNESGAIANGATLYSESGQHLGWVLWNGQVHLFGTSPPGDCPPGVEVCAWPVNPDPGARPVDPSNGDNGDTGARPAEPGSGDDGDTVTQPVVPVVPVNPGPVVPVFPGNPGDVAPSPCPPGVEVCGWPVDPGDGDDNNAGTQPVTGPVPASAPEEPAPAPQAPEPPPAETPSARAVADARESGEPEATVPDAGRVAETGASASDTSPDASMEAPATVGLASGSMMRLTAAALDQGAGPAGASAGRAGFATTGTSTSPGPWVRALAGGLSGLGRGAGGRVAGVAVGLDAELGDGFRFGTALAPAAEASSADGRSRLSGDVWTARLGWSAGGAFADAALAYGRSRARSQSVDVLTGDVLDGASGLVQSQLQAMAGHHVSAGGLVAVPSVSLFAGSLEHGARTAYGAVLRTEAPGFTQGYHGWKAGLTLGTEDWLSGSGRLRWRPHLRAEWERLTDEGPETLAVRKADRAGVLSFVSEERVERLPEEALRLDLGAELRGGSDAWGVGLGYSGAWTDGTPEHGVQARFSLRF